MNIFRKSGNKYQTDTLESLREMITQAQMPSYVEEIANKELEMLAKTSPTTAEYTIGLTYIDHLATMPWNKKTEDNLDIIRAERILNEDHHGLQKIKERILEHLAIKKLRMNRKPRILIVDDEEIARKNLQHILEKENYQVLLSPDGEDAFKKLESFEFDLILTDLRMEKIDGMDILENAKSKYHDTEVIMITGYATIATAIEAMKKGAYYYIAKPFKLDEVRSKVKEALEKRSLQKETKGSVLCFSGPPGTGKTSLGRSIARALGRKFARISLGGMKDDAEIMGHRRTYAGAMPGRIIQEIQRAESANPVMMLDEVDKISKDFKGDPASALLEVLDPEQNSTFMDNYLDVPFDLSSVMFIITANIVDNIQESLLDRMEVIEFSGYTEEEKLHIASQFLIPKQIREKGLSEYPPKFTSEAIYKTIQEYTREAGIRNLEREIATACRKIAKGFVHRKETIGTINVTPELIEKYLGPRKYYFEVAEEKNRIGVTTGLVWTEVGGDIIFVEAAKMKGKKELILTGSLGEIMRESAQAALSYIRSNSSRFGILEDFFEHHDIHIHVPAGAILKDGPSAGLTIAMALLSLLTERPAQRDVAMTGELTLTGRVLPVGGIKEKILAARRARVKTVILPLKNNADLEDLSEEIKKDIEIHLVDNIDEIIDLVLANPAVR